MRWDWKQKHHSRTTTNFVSNLSYRYMYKEGWAPAVYLKRVGATAGKSQTSLKRMPLMGMQLREETKDLDEVPSTGVQDGVSSRE